MAIDQEKDDDGSDGMAVEIERGGWIQDTCWHLHRKDIEQEGMEGRTISFEKDVLWALSSDKM